MIIIRFMSSKAAKCLRALSVNAPLGSSKPEPSTFVCSFCKMPWGSLHLRVRLRLKNIEVLSEMEQPRSLSEKIFHLLAYFLHIPNLIDQPCVSSLT